MNMTLPNHYPFSTFLKGIFQTGSLRARLVSGTFWTLTGSVVVQCSGLFGSILSARFLGQKAFGQLGMIRSTVLMFGVLAGAGIGMAATKYVASFRLTDTERAGRIIGLFINSALVLGSAVTLIGLIISRPLAEGAMNAPELTSTLRVGCLLLLFNTLNGLQMGILCGFEAFRTQSTLLIMDGICIVLLVPAGAFYWGINGAMAGYVVTAIIGLMLKQFAMKQACRDANIKVVYRNVAQDLDSLWTFVLPVVLTGVSIQPFEWFARLLLARQTNGFEQLGVFTAAFTWAQLVGFLPMQLAAPLVPIVSSLVATRQMAKLSKVTLGAHIVSFAIAGATALPIALLAPYILRAYGSGFASGRAMLWAMLGAYVISASTRITRALFAATDHMWMQVAHTITWGIVLLGGFSMLNSYGGYGLALAYLIAYGLFTVLQFFTQDHVIRRLISAS